MTMWKSVDYGKVRVTDKYLDEALEIEVKNLLALDADRLLAGFCENAVIIAGLGDDEREEFMKGKKRYDGWENSLIGGHTLGHYLTAVAQACVNPALDSRVRTDLRDRLEYMNSVLKKCQDLTVGTDNEGFLFGATILGSDPLLQFENVEKGLGNPFEEAWVPWYTMHKILSGLNAGYKIARSETSLLLANRLGSWIADRALGWSEEVHRTVLGIEYGGMNDCLYELYSINKENELMGSGEVFPGYDRFFEAAKQFDETALFEKISSGESDVLDNVHANTTIPKFVGAIAGYEAAELRGADGCDGQGERTAADFFKMVTEKHTYVTGGNSEDEHFGRDYVLDAERSNTNNETCNTYNMIKLARRLFAATGDKKYLDYAAGTFINAIVASQNHDTGFTTYFQPMGTGYQKVFCTFDRNFWCCTGTGYENFTKLQDGIYYKGDSRVLIGEYVSSELFTDGYTLAQSCSLLEDGRVTIEVRDIKGKEMPDDLWLRIPDWAEGAVSLCIDDGSDSASATRADGGLYIIPSSCIKEGTKITLTFPMKVKGYNLPDGENTYAFKYGPYVLSARLGNAKIRTKGHGIGVVVAAQSSVETDELKVTAPVTVQEFVRDINKYMLKREGSAEFDLTGVSKELVFTTHYNQYTESYGIYWKLK